ncbi:MAG: hypothetical protein PHG37_02765, partial [Candidatus Pacebacteria bacterium]|nr:hypothetical protein [Candidatus Paceibacterota bacterium]MDD4738062.1 hypothetical protein [Candidatus Paceibacterota bacterium]
MIETITLKIMPKKSHYKKRNILNIKNKKLFLFLTSVFLFFSVSFLSAWTGPPGAPPNCPAGSVGCAQLLDAGTDQSIGGIKTFTGTVIFNNPITVGTPTATTHAVRADRSISTGLGLTGGGNLTADRTLTVDSTVVRTTGDQSIGGTKTFTGTVIVQTPLLPAHATTKAYVDDLVGGVVVPGGRTAGDTGVGYLLYAGTTRTAGRLYGGTTAPSGTTRLNYDGY